MLSESAPVIILFTLVFELTSTLKSIFVGTVIIVLFSELMNTEKQHRALAGIIYIVNKESINVPSLRLYSIILLRL